MIIQWTAGANAQHQLGPWPVWTWATGDAGATVEPEAPGQGGRLERRKGRKRPPPTVTRHTGFVPPSPKEKRRAKAARKMLEAEKRLLDGDFRVTKGFLDGVLGEKELAALEEARARAAAEKQAEADRIIGEISRLQEEKASQAAQAQIRLFVYLLLLLLFFD